MHIYPSSFRFESRMLKETATAIASGVIDNVVIIARWEDGLVETEALDDRRRVLRLRTRVTQRYRGPGSGLVGFAEWYVRALVVTARLRPSIINPHSLPVLPLAAAVKLFGRCRLVYDTHELESETVGASRVRQRIGRFVEWLLVPYADAVVVVNRSIGDWYQERHPSSKVLVVRNLPLSRAEPAARTDLLRKDLGIPNDALVFLYQGVLYRGRGIELLTSIFEGMSADRHLVLLGYGELERPLRAIAEVHANIHVHDAVPPTELAGYTASADVGLCLIENVCKSYYLSLPNKLMEFVHNSVPVVASSFPEMSRFLDETGAGWTTDVDEPSVRKLLESLTPEAIAAKRQRAAEAGMYLSWESESKPLSDLYRSLTA